MDGGNFAFSPGQRAALDAIADWLDVYHVADHPIFSLAGFAGTGKTTLARHAVGQAGKAAFMAYTAKAAAVMRDNGCEGARNIHQWLYRSRSARPEITEDLRVTKEKVAAPDTAERPKRLAFDTRPTDDLVEAGIVVVDEASMVDDLIAADLLDLDLPVLAIYDPAQLPPVKGQGSLADGAADAFLSEIHRQAEGDPIITMSMRARQGQPIGSGDYGDRCFVRGLSLEAVAESQADQILCGRNDTRRRINDMIRRNRGFTGWLPEPGERLVVLRNRHDLGLYNGGIATVVGVATGRGATSGRPMVRLVVMPEGEDRTVEARVYPDDFFADFDFGYCLTVHKAQGSQWDSVMLVDESYCFRQHRHRWLYTGITRARSRLCVARVPL
jgi:exodeoxyribonuclease-5